MRSANEKFQTALNFEREELEHDDNPSEIATLKRDVYEVSAATGEMVKQAELIFSYFAEKRTDKAGERMATMDRKFAQLNAAITSLRQDVHRIQQTNYDKQIAIVNKFRHYEPPWISRWLIIVSHTAIADWVNCS